MSLACSARRAFIKGLCGVAVTSLVANKGHASPVIKGSRSLNLYNRHTGESVNHDFWIDGLYQPEALSGFDQVLRDHRQNIAAPMDKRLFELLHQLQSDLNNDAQIHIISGYRSPKTNAMLAARSNGVAKKSYHMRGMAMDIAIPGVDLANLRDAAKNLKLGGVGFYPRSGFIHVDTGRVRSW